jgi:hypothetical protein
MIANRVKFHGSLTYTPAEIDSLAVNGGSNNSLIKIDATHYMLANLKSSLYGHLMTFSLNGAYEVSLIDDIDPNPTGNTFHNSLVMIDSTHFMLAFISSEGLYGICKLKVFSIDGAYDNITELSSISHLTHPNNATILAYNSLVKIDATHFMLAFCDNNFDGFIKVFSIDGAYAITELTSLEHDTVQNSDNKLLMIDSTHFILAYSGDSTHGYIKTFSIDGSYNVTEIDSLEHETTYGNENSLVKIDNTHYILAYSRAGGVTPTAYIKTFSIDANADNITEIDVLGYDVSDPSDYNSLVKIDARQYMLSSQGIDSDGFITTFSIDSNYDNITLLQSLEHDTTNCLDNSLVQINLRHYMLAYATDNNTGVVKTFTMS